jgi:CubicO group peptidase (beta-lactamase class C family)
LNRPGLSAIWLTVCAIASHAQTTSKLPSSTTFPPPLSAAIEKIDAMAGTELAKDGVGSISVGVISSGKLVWTKSYGYSDAEKKTPAYRETQYHIASIGKQFTALMLLQLIEQGNVHLSEPVEKYLPEAKSIQGRYPDAPPITLVQLATMTAGLPYEAEEDAAVARAYREAYLEGKGTDALPAYLKGPISDWEKVLIAALPRTKYLCEPGTRFKYSPIGYVMLGAALQRAAGESYLDYIRQRILSPLAMTRTDFEPNPSKLAKGYVLYHGVTNTEIAARAHQEHGYKVPSGALYSTVDDLAKYVEFELGNGPSGVLKPASLNAALSGVNSANADLSFGYGIGLMAFRRGERVFLGHNGLGIGYQSAAFFDPAHKTGVIALSNVTDWNDDLTGIKSSATNVREFALRALVKLAEVREADREPYPSSLRRGARNRDVLLSQRRASRAN